MAMQEELLTGCTEASAVPQRRWLGSTLVALPGIVRTPTGHIGLTEAVAMPMSID